MIFALIGAFPSYAQKPAPAKPKTPAPYALSVSTKNLISVSLKAEHSPLPPIASELSKKLKVPVILGPSAEKWEVTADFKKMALEPALNLIAPKVFIDYEFNHAPGEGARAVGIYLNGFDDPEPPINKLIAARSEAMLFEGNTEDVSETTIPNEPVQVKFERNYLTIKAKRQPLTVIAYRVAEQIGVPFELRWESPDIIDVDINELPLEDALTRFSPHIRLYVRADLQTLERRPFRMLLVRPEKGS